MFTGIIEQSGTIRKIIRGEENVSFIIESDLSPELKVDQSLAHNGICLTVESIDGRLYQVTAVPETIQKTNAGTWQIGDSLNLERAMIMNGRLDGHMVQGHVDTTGVCLSVETLEDSWIYHFQFPSAFCKLMIEKGSVAVNGVSLTSYDVGEDTFTVSIIPYTYHHTNFPSVREGTVVNLEFDIIGKYISKMIGNVRT